MRSLFNTGEGTDNSIAGMYHPKMEKLKEVEAYFLDKVKQYDVAVSYDVTAGEALRFKTLNYTSFAGMLIAHPLRHDVSLQQMFEAYEDGEENTKYTDFLVESVWQGAASKYDIKIEPNESFIDADYLGEGQVLVVLPGGNKLAKHTCIGGIRRLFDLYGEEDVFFKKHPISEQAVYDTFFSFLQKEFNIKTINLIETEAPLYAILTKFDAVATGFLSESLAYAVALDKKVHNIDLFQSNSVAPFYHISYPIFSLEDPKRFINKAFNSYKSGVFSPDLDEDWKSKIDLYLEYIINKRDILGGMYA